MVRYGIYLPGRLPPLLSLPPSIPPRPSPGITYVMWRLTMPSDGVNTRPSSHYHLTPLLCPLRNTCGNIRAKIPTVTHIFPGLSTHTEWGRAHCPLADGSRTLHPISFNFTVIWRPPCTGPDATRLVHSQHTRPPTGERRPGTDAAIKCKIPTTKRGVHTGSLNTFCLRSAQGHFPRDKVVFPALSLTYRASSAAQLLHG